MTIKTVFFGSPDFSAQIAESLELIPSLEIVALVTNPDKQFGRKKVLVETPVAALGTKQHLPVFKPSKLEDDNLAHLKLFRPDLFIVAAYGKIIPKSWLQLPKLGTLNVHFSLLPKYRGALCVSEAIKNLDKETGVTLMEMDEALDHGPIVTQTSIEIADEDDVRSLTTRLTNIAIATLKNKLPIYIDWKKTGKPLYSSDLHLPPTAQDESKASYTDSTASRNYQNAYVPYQTIQKAFAGHLARETDALIRSLNPEPGAWTKYSGKIQQIELKVTKTTYCDGVLKIKEVQKPGKNAITWEQFISSQK